MIRILGLLQFILIGLQGTAGYIVTAVRPFTPVSISTCLPLFPLLMFLSRRK